MVILEVILLVYLLISLAMLMIGVLPAIFLFPVAPFLCAKEFRYEHPLMAWTIFVVWGVLYVAAVIALLISAMS